MNIMLGASYNNVKHIEHYFSDNVRMTLQDRINELFDEKSKADGKEFKNAALAKAVGCSRATVTDWKNGKTQEIKGDNAIKVSEFFCVNVKWLQTGEGPKHPIKPTATSSIYPLSLSPPRGYANTEPAPNINGKVPLISSVQAGNWAEIIDNFHVGDAEDWIDTTERITDSMFALRVVGDSMVNPEGFPSLPPGVIVIVDPTRIPKHNDIVVARLEDTMEATIKQLKIDGSYRYLKPLNPDYDPIRINGNCTICGVVISGTFKL